MSETDEIKSKIDIVQLISEYVPNLVQSGANWKACCPFHNEKTPSFLVSQDKQIYKCFGCGEGGDVFTFVQKMEGLDFPEALRLLAKRAGVEMKSYNPSMQTQKNKALDILNLTASYYQKILRASAGRIGLEYLQRRGVSEEMIDDFKLGFSPDSWDQTYKMLKGRNYLDQDILQAGLIIKKQDKHGYYDRFRGRLMFPIQDWHGNILGFTARTLDPHSKSAKYINSPQTPVYDKSRVLYGLDKAKQEVRKLKYIILVEGNMDVIASHQVGIRNTVAISGTALTADQINLIKRYTDNIVLCFDSDAAGESAMKKSIDLLMASSCNIKVIDLQDGKDPDEIIRKDPQLWPQSIKDSVEIMEYYWRKSYTGKDISNISHKKDIAQALLSQIAKLPQKMEQDMWINKLADSLGVNAEFLWEAVNRKSGSAVTVRKEDQADIKTRIQSADLDLLDIILGICLNYPENWNIVLKTLQPEYILDDEMREFYNKIIMVYNRFKNEELSTRESTRFSEYLIDSVDEEKQTKLKEFSLLAEENILDLSKVQITAEISKAVNNLVKKFYTRKIADLEKQVKFLENSKANQEEIDQLLHKYSFYLQQKNQFD